MNADRILLLASSLGLSDPRIKIVRSGDPDPDASLFVSVEAFAHGASYASAVAGDLEVAGKRLEEELAGKVREKLDEVERVAREMRRALTGERTT